MSLLPLVLLACSSAPPPQAPAPAPAAPTPAPEAPKDAAAAEKALLTAGPPTTLGPFGDALSRVATELGVGVVRCPLAGGGRAWEYYGTPRDQVMQVGPMMLLEVDPATEPPWHPVFDHVTADDQWLTFLAVPGQTHAWVATRTRILAYDFPAAVKGGRVACTSVEEVPPRAVRGHVDLTGTKELAVALPCAVNPKPIAKDGTFAQDFRVPCTAWVETENRQSDKVQVPPGTEPFEHDFVLGPPDELQNADRTLTEKGRKVIAADLEEWRARYDATRAVVEKVRQQVADQPEEVKVVGQWTFDLDVWNRLLGGVDLLLKPKPKAKAKSP